MELDYLEIGQNIRKLRIKRGLKQRELAERANICSEHISHIETGRAQVSPPDIGCDLQCIADRLQYLIRRDFDGSSKYSLPPKFEEVFAAMDSKKFQLAMKFAD